MVQPFTRLRTGAVATSTVAVTLPKLACCTRREFVCHTLQELMRCTPQMLPQRTGPPLLLWREQRMLAQRTPPDLLVRAHRAWRAQQLHLVVRGQRLLHCTQPRKGEVVHSTTVLRKNTCEMQGNLVKRRYWCVESRKKSMFVHWWIGLGFSGSVDLCVGVNVAGG